MRQKYGLVFDCSRVPPMDTIRRVSEGCRLSAATSRARRSIRTRSRRFYGRRPAASSVAERRGQVVEVRCGECGGGFTLSSRRAFEYRREGREPRVGRAGAPSDLGRTMETAPTGSSDLRSRSTGARNGNLGMRSCGPMAEPLYMPDPSLFGHSDAYRLYTTFASELEEAGFRDRLPREPELRNIVIEMLAGREHIDNLIEDPSVIDETIREAEEALAQRRQDRGAG